MIQNFDIHAVLPGLKPFTTVRNENDPKPCIASVPHVIRIYKQSDKASLNGEPAGTGGSDGGAGPVFL